MDFSETEASNYELYNSMSYAEQVYVSNAVGATINPATEEKQDAAIAAIGDGADWWHEVKTGNITGHAIVSKFGSADVGTSIVPIATGLVYQTPIAATALEFVSSSGNDSSAGTGAQEITITGLDSSWLEVTQTIETNGVTAVALPTNLIRLTRWYVSRSGTYATQSAGSHAGNMTIRVSGAGATWALIDAAPFPFGQSQIGCYTIPAGKTGYVVSKNFFSDSTKNVDLYFFHRPNANDVTAPFTGAMRVVEREVGSSGGFGPQWKAGKGPFVGPCDIGFMGVISVGTANIAVEFEILLIG